MTKEEIVGRIKEVAANHSMAEDYENLTVDDLKNLKADIEVNGKKYTLYEFGTDDCYDHNPNNLESDGCSDFFQFGIDDNGKLYEIFYDLTGGKEIDDILWDYADDIVEVTE